MSKKYVLRRTNGLCLARGCIDFEIVDYIEEVELGSVLVVIKE